MLAGAFVGECRKSRFLNRAYRPFLEFRKYETALKLFCGLVRLRSNFQLVTTHLSLKLSDLRATYEWLTTKKAVE